MSDHVPSLIRRARRLSAKRDELVAGLAREWASALRGRGLSREDLTEFWAALTEDSIRRLQRSAEGRWPAEAVRREAAAVIGQLRERVEREISPGRA